MLYNHGEEIFYIIVYDPILSSLPNLALPTAILPIISLLSPYVPIFLPYPSPRLSLSNSVSASSYIPPPTLARCLYTLIGLSWRAGWGSQQFSLTLLSVALRIDLHCGTVRHLSCSVVYSRSPRILF